MLPLLFALCTLLPASMTLAGHYFNWRGVLGGPLYAIEAYSWLMAFVVVTPAATILYAQRLAHLTPAVCVTLFCASAGFSASNVAHGIVWLVERYRILEDKIDRAEYRTE